MAGIDDVLERLVTDASFKKELVTDPKAALAGYELTADDVQLLAAQVTDDTGSLGAVEQRTSKAGLFGLFSQLVGHGGSGPAAAMKVGDGALDDQGLSAPHGGGGGDAQGIIIHATPAAPGGGGDAPTIIVYDAPAPQGSGADAVMFNPQPDPPGEPMLGGPDTAGGTEVGLAESSEMPAQFAGRGGEVGFGESSEMPAQFAGRGGEVGFGESSELPVGGHGGEVGFAESSEMPAPGAVSEGAVILESGQPPAPGEDVEGVVILESNGAPAPGEAVEGVVIIESGRAPSPGEDVMGATIEEMPAPVASGEHVMGAVLENPPPGLAPGEADGIIIEGGLPAPGEAEGIIIIGGVQE
jgi:hypothetical protein